MVQLSLLLPAHWLVSMAAISKHIEVMPQLAPTKLVEVRHSDLHTHSYCMHCVGDSIFDTERDAQGSALRNPGLQPPWFCWDL